MTEKKPVLGLPLRAVRKLLRRLDILIERKGRGVSLMPPPGNGREDEIEAFLARISAPDPHAAGYFLQHHSRLVRTLSLVPPGGKDSRALELGSYLQMSAVLERVLGYGHVAGAYYSPQVGRETKSLVISGQPPFTCAMDLFDAELHPFPYPDAHFDAVLCCELIEHLLHDPMHLLLECHRILQDGGMLLLTTPNIVSLTSVAAVLHGWRHPQTHSRYPAPGNTDLPHVREYTPRELQDALLAAGFTVEALFTERMPNVDEAGWVREFLETNGFDASLRGEQMYCLARKRPGAAQTRYPAFLYNQ
ncbi:MAG: hypothetical protein PGMFKBFP_00137 [Anaerolineales bacterium]|nr:hypothetical protein [Anaerolineales bacterium]